MKKINIKVFGVLALIAGFAISCKQDVITFTTPKPVYNKWKVGDADFTKFISIGNSLTSGYQAGALFTAGQQNSFPAILSKQFSLAKDSTGATTLTFNQPDINSVNGYSSSVTIGPNTVELGRYILFASDGNPNDALPTPAGYPGVPAPYNTAGPGFSDPTFYAITFDKTKLNNFGVPGILLGQCLIGATGGPSTNNPYFNPYYARFASTPGTSTIIGDALAAAPTFFTFDLGNNDVLGYATTGGDNSIPITSQANFQTYYQNAVGALLTNSTAKGVVTTIPDVTTIPFFNTVSYNAIPLTSDEVTQLMGATAFGGYNQVMQGLAGALTAAPGNFGLDAAHAAPIIAQINTRLVNYVVGNNPILLYDNSLIDMGPFFDGMLLAGAITSQQRAGLVPYEQIRQANSTDLICLTTGSVLGTLVGNNPLYINGVSVPLGDKYVLIKQEQDSVATAVTGYNSFIKGFAAANSSRLAVADVNAAFTSLVINQAYVSDGVMITPSFVPPFGAFSEDGVHPNSRGYAYMANIIIDAINSTFNANVPHASLAAYSGTGLPVTP
jgi:hypothetical protein